jgi:hypothetical protein
MSLSKTEERVIREIIARLECQPKSVNGEPFPRESDEVRAALTGSHAKIYLDTWVIAPMKLLLPESRNPSLAERLAR